jgi:hypothetical protein
MRHTKKTILASLASLALLPPTGTAAHTVIAPVSGTVTATHYYPSGAYHGGVDISSGRCNYWGIYGGLLGSFYWNVTIRTTTLSCYGTGSGTQNEVNHPFADGLTLRQWHFIKTSDSYDRTCDRCVLGNEGGTGNVTGPHAHLQVDKYGTSDTSWLRVVTGQVVTRGEAIGYLP